MEPEEKIKKTTGRRGLPCFLLIGPPLALLFVTISLAGPVLTDLIVYQTCLVSLQINATECLKLRTNAGSPEAMKLEAEVEPYASTIVMVKTSMESLLPALVCLFLGPWSDRGGRRPLFLLSFGGWTITYVTLTFMSNWNTNPWYLLLALVPTNILGALSTARLASICYISDTTPEKDRTLQLALQDISIWVGILVGALAAPTIYENYGYIHIFSTSATCSGIALAYIYFLVPETVDNSSKVPICGLFEISSVKEIVTSALMKRESFHRSIIWLSIFCLVSYNVIFQGDTVALEFLFTRTRLGWDVQNYSHFNVADSLLRMAGLCTVFLRNRIPGVTDTVLATVGLISCLGLALTRSLTWKDWHIYVAVGIGMFSQITVPAIRSIISKFVPSHDLGKVFSLAAMLEVLGTLAVTPLYTFIYSHYLPPIYPCPVYLLSTSLWALLILSVLCMEVLIRKSRKPPIYVAAAQEDF